MRSIRLPSGRPVRERPLPPGTKAYLAAFDRMLRAWADDDADAHCDAVAELDRRLPEVFADHGASDPRERREMRVLAPHEERVVRMLIDDVPRAEIAQRLGLTHQSVNQYASTAYRKLGVAPISQKGVARGRRAVSREALEAAYSLAA